MRRYYSGLFSPDGASVCITQSSNPFCAEPEEFHNSEINVFFVPIMLAGASAAIIYPRLNYLNSRNMTSDLFSSGAPPLIDGIPNSLPPHQMVSPHKVPVFVVWYLN